MAKTESITNLLKLNNADLSAVKANKILVTLGLLSEEERLSTKYAGKVKKFKALTEQSLRLRGKWRKPKQSGPDRAPLHYRHL